MRAIHKTTIKELESLKPAQKIGAEKMLSDGGGLYILARRLKNGDISRFFVFWRADKGIKKRLGIYPQTSLKQARELAGIERAKIDGLKNKQGYNITFKIAFGEFLAHYIEINKLRANTIKWLKSSYNIHLSKLDNLKLTDISKKDLIAIFTNLKNKPAKAKQTLGILNNFFKHAIQNDILSVNVASQIDLKSFIVKHSTKHASHFETIEQTKEYKRRIIQSSHNPLIRKCAILQLYTATRPSETTSAKWCEFDLINGFWHIPAEKMKAKEPFIIPLSKQILDFLKAFYEVEKQSQKGEPKGYLFMENNKLLNRKQLAYFIEKLGYKANELTPHGVRASFATITNELRNEHKQGLDIIDMCLAHKQKSTTFASYNHALLLKHRRELLQFWADKLGDIC